MFKKALFLFTATVFSLALFGCKAEDINENAVPEIVVNNSLPTVFEVGDDEPDWTTYFIVEDENDGTIEVTNDMITEDVDMSTPGVYVVRIDVYNSIEAYNFLELTIEVESDIEITVEYVMTQGVVGNTYKFEGVEVVYKTNDEYGLYIYDANAASDYNYFYITAYEETLSDAMFDINVGDIIDIAGELVLYRGNQQPRFENVTIIDKTGTANNPHVIDDCVQLTLEEYYNLPWDTTDESDTERDAWLTFARCYEIQGVHTDVSGYYYLFDALDTSIGAYAWAYGEGIPIADFENAANVGKAVTVKTFFYNMHTVSTPPGDFVRSAMIDVTVHDGFATALGDIAADLALNEEKTVNADLTLTASGTGYTVSWASSDTAVIATDGTVTRGSYNEDVTLTYTITEGSDTFTGSITVTVIGLVAPPTITVNPGVDLELDLNGTAPDWTTYFTVSDETDGNIPVTAAMITDDVDMTTLGAYMVTISVTNSNDLTSEQSIIVNVTDGTTVIDAAWLLTDVANKVDKLYTLTDVTLVSKGLYGDEGYVFDGTNFLYIDAYGTDFEDAFVDAQVGDTVTVTGYLSALYDYKYYLADIVFFEVTAEDDTQVDFDSLCIDVTAAELSALVENADTFIKCYDVTGTVVEELYEGDYYYNLADTVDDTKYFIAYSLTPELPKAEFDLNNGNEVTVRMFLQYYRSDRSHYGYYWITEVLESAVEVDINYIVTNSSEGDTVGLDGVTVVSKTNDEAGLYVFDGTHFLYVNAYGTAFQSEAEAIQVGDVINFSGLYAYNYTYKMEVNALTALSVVTAGDGTFDFTGLCVEVTASELFAIKTTAEAFINCYDVTGETWLEDGTYMNFGDIVNTSEYFIAYSYAPDAPKAEFDALGDANEATVRMFYFRYRDDKSHGGYYWMLEVLSYANPVITHTGEPLLVPLGAAEPDWTTYFEVNDMQDGAITVTSAMITEDVDMATAGAYTVTLSVTDADSNTATLTLDVTVVDPATIDIPWIVANGQSGQSFTLTDVTVVSKTSDGSGMYVYDGTYFFYVNAYYSGDTLKNAAIALNEGDIVTIEGDLYVNYTYKKQLDITAITLNTASTGPFDWTGTCEEVTASELFAIKDDGMTFTKCFIVSGVVWVEDGQYYNLQDAVNTDEYFIEYGYGPTAPQADFEGLQDGENATVRMFLFRYRDDRSHGGYYWIVELLSYENPQISETGEPTIFPQGETEPDWTTYFEVNDLQDGAITVTAAMITEDVDMTTAGNYTVTLTFTDSDGNTATHTIDITVAAPATMDIPWIVANGLAGQNFTLEGVTVVSKTKDETGLYVFDGTHFIYVNAYYSGDTLKNEAIALNVGDVIDVSGDLYVDYTYKKTLDATSFTLVTAGAGTFDFTGLCETVTVSELFAIKADGMTFTNCYDVTGETWIEAGQYMNFGDLVNTSEYFIAYSYAPLDPKAEFDTLGDANEATVRMFYFRYRDDKSHGGYYWILDVLSYENPIISETGGQLLLPQGETEPDWTTYFEVNDMQDGAITVTAGMITEDVDMATAGAYTVTISVTDADGNTVTKTLDVSVVDPASIDIPWIVANGMSGQSFTLTDVTVVSKTSDGSGMYVYDGTHFFYVNAYYSGDTLKNAAIALNEGDIVTIEGDLYINYTYKKQLDITAITLTTASTGDFDWTGTCEVMTVSELFAIKEDGMTFTKCFELSGVVWLEAGTYHNMQDAVNTTEYFIEYGYGPTAPQDVFETYTDGQAFTVRMFLFRYRDDKSHGGYYWIDEVLS